MLKSKVILGLVFALSFSLVIGSSHVYAQTGPTCPAHSTFHVGPGGVGGACTCDFGFTQTGGTLDSPICTAIPTVVGGMGIPIDSTALLLAGVQGSALWMIPALVIAGAGIGIFSFKRSKKFSGKEDKS